MINKKYALHPGWVTSRYDREQHYITAGALAELYGLKPDQYVVWIFPNNIGCEWSNYIHLYPKYHGDYKKINHSTEKDLLEQAKELRQNARAKANRTITGS